ncbi:MAG: polyprenyl synthetase family protein, partial [Desulfatiglandales bacterium]
RPSIAILSSEAVVGTMGDALPLAMSLELIHAATLIYDDIIDKDKIRRGIPSLHIKYGDDLAIVAGAILATRAIEEIRGDTRVFPLVFDAMHETSVGEAMDIRLDIFNERIYYDMVRRKCASLIRVAAEAGGIVGGGSKREVKALSQYGENLGIAFQVRDDILDFVGDESVLGKPLGSDIRAKGNSIVVIKLADKLGVNTQELDETGLDTKGLIDLAVSSGCIRISEKACEYYGSRAKSALSMLKDSREKDYLINLADFVTNRDY